MKAAKYLAIVWIGLFLFAACQKEFSFERGNPASGTLKDTAGNCLPVAINGRYSVDSTLTDSNYVVIKVNFSTPGSYTIFTDSSNGFSFQASGFVKDTGMQSIRLMGTGKPTVSQQTDFSVVFDSSICTFSVSVAGSTGAETAIYTLSGSPNNCLNSSVQGNYWEGTPLNSANKVSIQVNVDTAGTYFITASPANGMSFNAQGVFTSTGVQTVVLQGSGTPTTAGTTTVRVNAGGTSCSFTVTVNSTRLPGEDSAWQFSSGVNFYHGFIDRALTQIVPELDSATALSFYGFSYPGPDTLFQMDILLPGNTIQTGIYNTDSANADFYLYNTDTTQTPYYTADFTATPAVNVQIEIKTYDPVTKIVTGTFSGTAVNAAGQKVNITGGKIYAKVD